MTLTRGQQKAMFASRKYPKRTNNIFPKGNIDLDYHYYLGQEGLFHTLYGHRLTPTERKKRDYIWNSLLKSYDRKKQTR